MATLRLYHEDPLLLGFDAQVVEHAAWEGRPSVILDRTAFYPESGGQMADRGTLAGLAVTDVQVDEAGVVHHVLDGDRPPIGEALRGAVDRARRRLHMALHTGQHMLSRALLDEAGLATVSSRLGESSCTIDGEGGSVVADAEAGIARAEALVNAVIEDDVPVRAYFPTPEELAKIPLRRAPKVTEGVRIVEVAGFDFTPCGGTHCLSTAQVGLVQVTGVERYKGKLRVSFAAGRRARLGLAAERERLVAIARDLTCGPSDVAAAVDKLRRELADARDAGGRLRSRLAATESSALVARLRDAGGLRAVAVFDDVGVDFLRAVAGKVVEVEGAVAFLAARGPEGLSVLVARGAGSTFDCGAFVKRAAAAHGGRGGGKPERAEGRLPPGVAWDEAVRLHVPA